MKRNIGGAGGNDAVISAWAWTACPKEADAAFALREQALAIDSNNGRALMVLGVKFLAPALLGISGNPKGDLARADEFESKALALDPDYGWAHDLKGGILRLQGRPEEAGAEHERALALDPSNVDAAAGLGIDYLDLGRFDKSLEYFDKAILASPSDPTLAWWYGNKARANFGLKNYDQAIELARKAIAIHPNYNPVSHAILVARSGLRFETAAIRRFQPAVLRNCGHSLTGRRMGQFDECGRSSQEITGFRLSAHAASSVSKAFAFVKSGASKPSVNEP